MRNFARSACTIGLAVALFAGCGAAQPPIGAPGVTLTVPPSYMQPDAGKKSALIYAGGDYTGYQSVIYVYNYATGKQVGELTGLAPYGMCVDKKGDVYIVNRTGGDVVEYAHGGSKPINTYNTGGDPRGCSLDAKGDLAVTIYHPGEAIIFSGGNPSKSTTYTSPCAYQDPMGYDDKGNLVGLNDAATGACALLSGSASMTTLSFQGFTIYYPGGTMWDGKYLALNDYALSISRYKIVQATLSATTLVKEGETDLNDDCGSFVSIVPFIVGKKNTPRNHRQGKTLVGSNDAYGCGGIEFWHYPAGGTPFKKYKLDPAYFIAASLKP